MTAEESWPGASGGILNYHFHIPYFQALNNAPIPVFITCEDGRLLLVNRAVQQQTGFSVNDIPTVQDLARHIRHDSDEDDERHFTRLFDTEQSLKPFRVSVNTKDGTSRVWELFNAPLGRTKEDLRLIISIGLDVTEKIDHQHHLEAVMNRLELAVAERTQDLNASIRKLEEEIAERKRMGEALTLSRERLKQMSRRTLDVLEADRRTVSKELHDSIGAGLAAIKFSLEEKEMNRVQNKGCLDASLQQEIDYLMETIKETKRISANLRPTTLDDLGLIATVRWYCRQFQRMYGNIRIHHEMEITDEDIPDPMKIIIYRIVQEGLSNAQKHSEASSVRLHMTFAENKDSISLVIEDDGLGFDVEEMLSDKDPLSGYGLTAMRERCEIFGGSFHIDSRVGKGTTLIAILPI